MNTTDCPRTILSSVAARYATPPWNALLRLLVPLWAASALVGCATTGRESRSATPRPRIPAPTGYADATAFADKLNKAMGVTVVPPDASLLGAYFPTNRLPDLLAGRVSAPTPCCLASIVEEHPTARVATKAFNEFAVNAKAKMPTRFDLNDPAFKDAVRTMKKYGLRPGGMSMLGTILENDQAYATCMLITYGVPTGRTQKTVAWATASAWMRVGSRILEAQVMYPFRDESSVVSCNQKLIKWVAAIEQQNPSE